MFPTLSRHRMLRFIGLVLLSGLLVIALWHLLPRPTPPPRPSSYALSLTAPFNRPEHFPLAQTLDPPYYRPTGEWVGRLILPTPEQQRHWGAADWVWVELYQVPESAQDLQGRTVRLQWANRPAPQVYRLAVTTDVQLTESADRSARLGNVIPTRLNGRRQVGPLQSLAGARPNDDVIVSLSSLTIRRRGTAGDIFLETEREPTLVTGRFYGLVKILAAVDHPDYPAPTDCPTAPTCGSEVFRIRHYNPTSRDFDGPEGYVRIPQQPRDRDDRFLSTPNQLTESPLGKAGWYIYGARDAQGMFTVEALRPRSLFRLQPDQVLNGQRAGLQYIQRGNWHKTPQRKGTAQSVLISSRSEPPEAAIARWQEGDQALVIHSFGGIGGRQGEPTPGATVTGHFSYGLARVVRDPFTQELQFEIKYQQIYAHNPNGIISATHTWESYMGNLQRGWLGSRPVADIIVKLDALNQPLRINDTSLSLLRELLIQTQVMMARYRTGDGTGVATVTPATSCVQDSNQALYIALTRLRSQVESDPTLLQWLAAHPNVPQTQHFQQLVSLARALVDKLAPYGTVRPDWRQNAESLAGVSARNGFVSDSRLVMGLLSWQSMMPRRAQDEISRIFLMQGADLWFLRPNQVGGWDPNIEPIAPTLLFGRLPLLGTALDRFTQAWIRPITPLMWTVAAVGLLLYGAIALPLGWRSGFLARQPVPFTVRGWLLRAIALFFLPALGEEIVFRICLIPNITEGVPMVSWLAWAAFSLGLFVAYHPLAACSIYKAGYPTFLSPAFLLLATWLGVICTLIYGVTGSLWLPVWVHWLVVVVWILGLGGAQKLTDGALRGKLACSQNWGW
ncbi:CPBP family glutamic-type intramembrane protease [Trichothermofontia sichuanensis B231]|uniref:CPBP family glutamic-type intramembrane protease n=1 Tax=Trichothermofontia sichuanensis TaxID=3045816 RepID=UPI002247080C|nr:CPBP family glutamic-type intramembrane protease [Trichothermofontia sichuanensis]UZQ54508.1 CPBP family glutamic-type intramembrane protease [Trichothermofontia sichuanensis B231]